MPHTKTISNSDDVIDSRDIIERIEELESEREALADTLQEAKDTRDEHEDEKLALEDWDTDNGDELKVLKAIAEEASGYASDWKYGEALIRDSYFQTYAQELAEDIGAINKSATWPNNHIDWEAATEALKMDYTSVDFDGIEYWIRCS